ADRAEGDLWQRQRQIRLPRPVVRERHEPIGTGGRVQVAPAGPGVTAAVARPDAVAKPMQVIVVAILGMILGLLLPVTIPITYARYTAVALLAAWTRSSASGSLTT